ncbi:hypothetical protein [Methylomonas sp. UP202]|uniref:hypothetical protein n=1 Tax=Methylomonas sp. UP202 TaxID=3040943 RepID=UPI00143AAAA0|nr:hypothetical protein [Methylomonas sp. UP202]NJA07648.1 hypothetical protein [Methylococcaceae bacterium WWC4]WGS85258.1 hypothetical protein QC632_19760 [Methylomonas sp. UP202]
MAENNKSENGSIENSFNLFDSPLSEETKKHKRNSIIASGICLFIALTATLPEKLAIFGINFSTFVQQKTAGWFIFSVSIYIFLYYLAYALPEIAKWLRPLFTLRSLNKRLKNHPSFDGQDFSDFSGSDNPHNVGEFYIYHLKASERESEKRLKPLLNFIYLRLFLEIALPVFIGVLAHIMYFNFIANL